MFTISTYFDVGLLWLLLTIYSRSSYEDQSLQETWIVIIGILMVGILGRVLLRPIAPGLVTIAQVIALFLLVEKVCETDRKTTLKICGWYLLASFLAGLIFRILFVF